MPRSRNTTPTSKRLPLLVPRSWLRRMASPPAPPLRCCCWSAAIPSASSRKQLSPRCVAPVQSQRPAAKPTAIGSTAAVIDRLTQLSTVLSSFACAAISQPWTTSGAAWRRARANQRSSAASSDTSHEKSLAISATRQKPPLPQQMPLDRYRSINALAETINGLYKAEVIHRRGPRRSFEAVEFATLEWVDWFNHRRLLEPIGHT